MPTSPIVSIKYNVLTLTFELTYADGSVHQWDEPLTLLAHTLDAAEWAAVQEAIKTPYTFVSVK